jgi:hypothetical protein
MDKLFSCECKSIDHDHTGVVLKQISDLLQQLGLSQFMMRKVYTVASECVDNVLYHGLFDKKYPECQAIFSIYSDSQSIFVEVSNCIKNEDIPNLQYIVENVNYIRNTELKSYFQNTIKEKSLNKKGGAGVGLIIMKRKSELPIELKVEQINQKISNITLKIEIEIGKMKKFKKLPTKHTPSVNFNISTGIFSLSGVSRPENADAFYDELIHWIEEHTHEISLLENYLLQIDLEYFNSVSCKNLLRLLRQIISINPSKVTVEWSYDSDDEALKDEGEELSEILKKEFVFIEKE